MFSLPLAAAQIDSILIGQKIGGPGGLTLRPGSATDKGWGVPVA